MAMAFMSEPEANTTAPTRPNTIREKYSAGPNLKASSANGGANAAINNVATLPAKNEPKAAIASAAPARPFLAMACPSSTVTTEEVSPGRFTKIAVVEPPYCVP